LKDGRGTFVLYAAFMQKQDHIFAEESKSGPEYDQRSSGDCFIADRKYVCYILYNPKDRKCNIYSMIFYPKYE